MATETLADPQAVAARAAEDAVTVLSEAIKARGVASWALAGGTSPMAAYAKLAQEYSDALDWSKVTVLIGDERCVAHDQPDSNWGAISKVLFTSPALGRLAKLVPQAEAGAEEGARLYDELLRSRLADASGALHLDLLWLGVGEDGHTLSLFPGHTEIDATEALVLPVHDSPKPPPDRITLSFPVAAAARAVVIFATGAAKKEALAKIRQDPASLPIGRVARAAETAGARVLWLYDEAAA
ncbi:MAG TPA: 6-phosphogluconolactonase [Candidatus Saccharimonadia bacterium]|nr:6-phosphogluconolactonase [Candidatus Saccharimonadia bacterium]